MKILQAKADIADAEQRLKRAFESRNAQILPATIGYQSGSYETDVMWLPSLGIWVYFGLPPNEKSPGKRYWNAFGEGKPHGVLSIICEINPPIEGINRKAAGAFAQTDNNDVALLHRGRLNITGGITKESFRQQYRGRWVDVNDGGVTASFVHVADLSSPDVCEKIRDFVLEVNRIKRLARK